VPGLSLSGTSRATSEDKTPKVPEPAGPPKINLQKEENFPAWKSTAKITSFYQQLTTHLPSKNHVLHTVFRKNPCKNALLPVLKKFATTSHLKRRNQLVE
jgi:hypothetical protein